MCLFSSSRRSVLARNKQETKNSIVKTVQGSQGYMLARQITPKSYSLRRLLCRSNMAVHMCSRKYTFFTVMLAISTVAASNSDPPATCSSDTVMEGDTGVITLSFSQEIQFRIEHTVFFSLRRGYEPVVLACSWLDANSTKECKVENKFRGTFHSNGLVDHNVTLVIPNVTLDLQGTYILTGHVKGSQVPPVNCTLTVLGTEKTTQVVLACSCLDANSTKECKVENKFRGTFHSNGLVDHNVTQVPPVNCTLTVLGTEKTTQAKFVTEDSSEVVSIVAPVLVVMAVINIIVILLWHRESVRNCVYRNTEASWSDETETMTESVPGQNQDNLS